MKRRHPIHCRPGGAREHGFEREYFEEVVSSQAVEVEFVITTRCGFGCGEKLHMYERRAHENKYCTRWSIVQKRLGVRQNGSGSGGSGGGGGGGGNSGGGEGLSELHPGRQRTPRRKSVEEIEEDERKEYEQDTNHNSDRRSTVNGDHSSSSSR